MNGSPGGFGCQDELDGLIGYLDNEDNELLGLSPSNKGLQELLAQEAPEWARSEDIPFEPDGQHHTQLDFLHDWVLRQDDYPSTSSASTSMSQENNSMPSCPTSSSKSTDEAHSPHNTSTPDSMGPSTSSRSDSGEDDIGANTAHVASATSPAQPGAPPSGPLWDLLMRTPSPAKEKSTEDDDEVQVISDQAAPAQQQPGPSHMPPPLLPPLRPEFISAVQDRVQMVAPQLAFSNDPLVNQKLNRYMHIGQTEVQLSPAVLRQQKMDIVKRKRKKTEKKAMEDSRYYVPRAAANEARQPPVMSDNGHFYQSFDSNGISNMPYGTDAAMAQGRGGLMPDQPSTSGQSQPQPQQTWHPAGANQNNIVPGQTQSGWMQQNGGGNGDIVQFPSCSGLGHTLSSVQPHPNPMPQTLHHSGTWRPQAQWNGRPDRPMQGQHGHTTTPMMSLQQPGPSGQQGSSWQQQQQGPLPLQQLHQPSPSSLSPEHRRMHERARLHRESLLHENQQRATLAASRRRSPTSTVVSPPGPQQPVVRLYPQLWPEEQEPVQQNPPHIQAHIERQRAEEARQEMQQGSSPAAEVQPLAATSAVPSGSASSPIALIDSNDSSPATSPSEEEQPRPAYFSTRFTEEQAEVWCDALAWEALLAFASNKKVPAYGSDGHYTPLSELVLSHRFVDGELAAMGHTLHWKSVHFVSAHYYGGKPLSPSPFYHPARPIQPAAATKKGSDEGETHDEGSPMKKSPDEPSASRDGEPPQPNNDEDPLQIALDVIDVIVEESPLEEALERSCENKEDQPCCSTSLD